MGFNSGFKGLNYIVYLRSSYSWINNITTYMVRTGCAWALGR